MADAWKILLALTFARATMGFQFQSVPALGFALTEQNGMSFAALGALTGAYLLPGALVALLGGGVAQRIGTSRVAFCGLALMSVGGFGLWMANTYEASLFWRVLSGIGAVGLNVMLTKMAADWFDQRPDMPTAMGVLVSSWPFGIALASLYLPFVAGVSSLEIALLVSAIVAVVGWAVLWIVWREPVGAAAKKGPSGKISLNGQEWLCVGLAGLIWGIYNVALIGAIAWTPGLIQAAGVPAVFATASSSAIGWAAIFSVAAGGWLAAKSSNKDLPAILCFVFSALLIALLPSLGVWAGSIWVMLLIGLAIGPAAALIMTLPVEATRPHLRALTMGIYFAIYYALMGVGPAVLGFARDATGSPGAPLFLSAFLLIGVCLPALLLFRRLQK